MGAITTRRALADPPEVAERNPIHSTAASHYGYNAGIVSGICTYGWATETIIAALGEEWLYEGWAEVRFRRPVFGDEQIKTTVRDDGTFTQVVGKRAVLQGTVGLGRAPWIDEFDLPTRRDAEPPSSEPSVLDPRAIPTGEDYRPMAVDLSAERARAWATERLDDANPRWQEGDQPLVHPSFAPGLMTPLIRHSHRFAAGIHVSGRIQHLAPLRAGGRLVLSGRWGDVTEKDGRAWSATDGVLSAEDGTALTLMRQVAIFLAASG